MAKILGITDEVTTCECCGRTNLKKTVAIELYDGGMPVYYGCDCAARAYKQAHVKNFNRQDVELLGRYANMVKKHGRQAAFNRFGFCGDDALVLSAR